MSADYDYGSAVAIATQVMNDHPVLVALMNTAHSDFREGGRAAIDELTRLRGRIADLEGTETGALLDRIEAVREAGREVARLLKGAVKDAPPTDIRAEAIEAADRLLGVLG